MDLIATHVMLPPGKRIVPDRAYIRRPDARSFTFLGPPAPRWHPLNHTEPVGYCSALSALPLRSSTMSLGSFSVENMPTANVPDVPSTSWLSPTPQWHARAISAAQSPERAASVASDSLYMHSSRALVPSQPSPAYNRRRTHFQARAHCVQSHMTTPARSAIGPLRTCALRCLPRD